MAHKKAQGSTSNIHDSQAQRLGLKKTHGEAIEAGQIIIKQRGTKYRPGKNVKRGNDDTLYAAVPGIVNFKKKIFPNFTGKLRRKTVVEVK
ncbi:50S ribosomal protein L27 [Patescibacteria group bacterium]|nr:50S ribosomal protein L27 [Patescibacteria group bacterium]